MGLTYLKSYMGEALFYYSLNKRNFENTYFNSRCLVLFRIKTILVRTTFNIIYREWIAGVKKCKSWTSDQAPGEVQHTYQIISN